MPSRCSSTYYVDCFVLSCDHHLWNNDLHQHHFYLNFLPHKQYDLNWWYVHIHIHIGDDYVHHNYFDLKFLPHERYDLN
jgi:hypothetical protein